MKTVTDFENAMCQRYGRGWRSMVAKRCGVDAIRVRLALKGCHDAISCVYAIVDLMGGWQ